MVLNSVSTQNKSRDISRKHENPNSAYTVDSMCVSRDYTRILCNNNFPDTFEFRSFDINTNRNNLYVCMCVYECLSV